MEYVNSKWNLVYIDQIEKHELELWPRRLQSDYNQEFVASLNVVNLHFSDLKAWASAEIIRLEIKELQP